MEFSSSKQSLVTALTQASNIVDRKSSMPVLSNVYLATQDTGILVAATDLNISLRGVFPAKVASEGEITVPAKMFFDIVRNLPDGEIHVKTDKETVEVTSGRSRFKVLGLPAEDFPALPEIDDVSFFTIEADMLCAMIDKTGFSISTDDARPHLNGAFFMGDGKILRMVTTDGHRLSKVEYKTDQSGFYNFSMVIPSKAVTEIRKLVDDGAQVVEIGTHEGMIFVRCAVEIEKPVDDEPAKTADIVLVSKLIESEFPPYDKVIPKSNDKRIVLPRVEMLEALRRVSLASTDRTLGVQFWLSEGTIEIVTDNPTVAEGREPVDVDYQGEEMRIGFNARYFIDALSVLDGKEVVLELSGSLDPAVIKEDDASFIGVVMPIRI